MNLNTNNLFVNSSTIANLSTNSTNLTYTNLNTNNMTSNTSLVSTLIIAPLATTTDLINTNTTTTTLQLSSGIMTYSSRPFGRLSGSTAQSIANATDIVLTTYWTTTNTVANMTYASGVYTITVAGKYYITANVNISSNATGIRAVWLSKNNVITATGRISETIVLPISGDRTELYCTATVDLAATDTMRVYIYHTAGGALAMDTGVPGNFEMICIG